MRVSRKWLIGFRIGVGLISGRRSTGEPGNIGHEPLRQRPTRPRLRPRHMPLHVIVAVVLVTSLAIHRHILPLTTITWKPVKISS